MLLLRKNGNTLILLMSPLQIRNYVNSVNRSVSNSQLVITLLVHQLRNFFSAVFFSRSRH